LKIVQPGPGIKVAVYAGKEDQPVTFAYWREGSAPVSIIAKQEVSYRIDLIALSTRSAGQDYKLLTQELRPAIAADDLRLNAGQKFTEAEQLTERGDEQSLRAALASYQQSFDLWLRADDRPEAARSLLAIGESFAQLGETSSAEDSYRQALQIGRELQDPDLQIRAENGLGFALIYANRYAEALNSCNEALSLSRQAGDQRGEAQSLTNLGEYHYFQGDRETALGFWRQAFPLWLKANDLRGQALTLQLQGDAHTGLNEGAKAEDSYQNALRLWRELGDRRNEARALTAIGLGHALVGKRQEALNLFQQAVEIFEPLRDKLGEAMTLNKIGFVYDELGRREVAIQYYDQARRLYRDLNLRIGEAGQTMKMGEMYFLLGDRRKALRLLKESLELNRQVDNKRTLSCNFNDLGWVYESSGEWGRAIDHYSKSLALNRLVKDKRAEAYTLNYLGRAHAEMGRMAEAGGYYAEALNLNQMTADRTGESLTRYHMALAARRQGEWGEARRQAEASLALSESLRSDVVNSDLRISFLSTIRPRYDFYIDLLMQISRHQGGDELKALAWQASEKERARGLLDLLAEARADIHEGVRPELLERRLALHRQINDRADRQIALLAGNHTPAEAEAARNEIAALLTEWQRLEAQIKVASPRYATITAPQPLTLPELQRDILDDQTLLLEYALGDDRSYLWAVTSTGMTTHELPARATIERISADLYKRLTARQPLPGETVPRYRARVARADAECRRLSTLLSKTLIGQVAGQLGTRRLIVIAEGALQYIPFAALPESTATGLQPLIVNHEIIVQPSASMLAMLRRNPIPRQNSKSVAVLADPIFEKGDDRLGLPGASPDKGAAEVLAMTDPRDNAGLRGALTDPFRLKRLPATDREANAIIAAAPAGSYRKIVGAEASRAIVASGELSQYRIVHFATHGLLDTENPELSAIALSRFDPRGQPCDGLMRLHDIYNLRLPVDLVVLSACNTALGRDVRGEGLMALTRGFLYAGASRVVASLWKVDDDATAELMRSFYTNLFKEKMPPPAALRAAQVALYQGRQWDAPFYWAAFVIQGEYR
jgi:CHAT domain-containing protein/tetratricopeptide (TPR) repeat protein